MMRDLSHVLTADVDTQPNFDQAKYRQDYAEWLKRFQQDLIDATQSHSGHEINQDEAERLLNILFKNSIAPGKKGNFLSVC